MTKSHLQPQPPLIFEILEDFFKDQGFDYLAVLDQFRKETPSGWINVIFSASNYQDVTLLEMTFGSRIDWVEETIYPYSAGLSGFQAEGNTCITNLAKYWEKPHFRFKIYKDSDWYRVAAELRDFFEREGFTFLESLQDARRCEEFFNANPQKECLVSFNHQLRSFRGLALASLVQSPRWSELCETYKNMLGRYGSPHLVKERYDQLTLFLADMGLN
jgi:hypothetical protein